MKRLSVFERDEIVSALEKEMMDKFGKQSQEIIKLKDEIGELKEANALLARSRDRWRDSKERLTNDIGGIEEKAKAWDDLEALIDECKDKNKCEFIEIDKGEIRVLSTCWNGADYVFEGEFNKEAVSNALESIRGES